MRRFPLVLLTVLWTAAALAQELPLTVVQYGPAPFNRQNPQVASDGTNLACRRPPRVSATFSWPGGKFSQAAAPARATPSRGKTPAICSSPRSGPASARHWPSRDEEHGVVLLPLPGGAAAFYQRVASESEFGKVSRAFVRFVGITPRIRAARH